MPKTAVQTAVCDICGAEVRDGSVFCYNCGGPLAKLEEVAAIPPPAEPMIAAEPVTNGAVTKVDEVSPKQRTDRRRVRASNREPAEIVWAPREGVSWAFVVTSIIFVIIALAVVIAAVYVQ